MLGEVEHERDHDKPQAPEELDRQIQVFASEPSDVLHPDQHRKEATHELPTVQECASCSACLVSDAPAELLAVRVEHAHALGRKADRVQETYADELADQAPRPGSCCFRKMGYIAKDGGLADNFLDPTSLPFDELAGPDMLDGNAAASKNG